MKLTRRTAIGGMVCSVCLSNTGNASASKTGSEELHSYFPCSSYPLPDTDAEAAEFGAENVSIATGVDSELGTTEFGVATAKKRWRKSDGLTKGTGLITLGVYFYNGTQSEQKKLIKRANDWIDARLSKKLLLKFHASEEEAQIRVHFDPNGPNNSAVGRDALRNRFSGLPTMNIRDLSSVRHEFGHALCLRHEHRHEELPFSFNEEEVISAMSKPPNNWSESKTRRNILTPMKGGKCVGDTAFNEDSVMIYDLPERWIEDEGVSISSNKRISRRDRNCIYAIYEA